MKAQIINKKVMLNATVIRCGDKNVDKIVFECPLYYGNLSLEDLDVYVKTENRLGERAKSVLNYVKEDDKLLIEWNITEEVTAVNGNLSCQLSFESSDGEKVLNTNVFDVLIENSIKEGLPRVCVEYNHIIQLQNELQRALKEDVIKKGSNISLLNNDANYLTAQDMSENFLTKDDASKTYQTIEGCEANYLTKASASEIYATSEKVASDYLTKASASEVYATKQEMATCLTKDDASKTYQTIEGCEANYLTKASASEIYATSEKVASDYLTKASASESYLTKTQASQTYLTSERASSDYLKKASASEVYATKQEMTTCLTKDDASKTYQTIEGCETNYLTKASASESYLTKTQASQTYLTSEKASSDYLKKASASESYLTKTQASQTYLTSEKASNDYLTKVKAGQEYATKEEVDNLSFGLFFDDYQSFLQNANLNQNQHKINCVIRIKSGKICDLCVSAIKTEFVNCELTEEEFASALLNVGVVQAGYCEYIPAKALAYSDSLPEVSKEDAGKYLSVNDNGEWQADRIEAYVGEVEGGTVVETIKGVGIKEIYSGESVNYGDATITPVTFVKSDDSQRTIDIAAKNGTDIISVESGSVSESDDYSIIPITFNKNDGNSFSTQIMVKNGRNGVDGVSITSIIYGQPTIEGEYTVTPITFTKSNGTSIGAYIKAKSGRGIASFEIVDGEIIVNYSDGASENIGALYDVANSNSFGLIKADAKYISDTMPVRISTDGKLYTNPGTLYSHTITISGATFKCMINILSAKNTTVADQLTLNSIISAGYHVATGKINSNAIMAVRRANTAFYMIDINGTETSVAYKDMTFSDVVRSITAEVVT